MQISASCYALTGLACESPWTVNAGLIAGEKRTLIIDTGSNRLGAQTIYGYARAVRPANEIIAINTEQHLDHVGGNGFLREQGVEIYGHHRINRRSEDLQAAIEDYNQTIVNPVRRDLAEGRLFYAQTAIANPSRPLDEEISLDLGGRRVQILFAPGHTPTNLLVWLPDERILYCGDCLVNDYLPNLESGSLDEWFSWWWSLEKLEKLAPAKVVPGHGQVLEGERLEAEIKRHRSVLLKAADKGVAPTLVPAWQAERARLLPRVQELPELNYTIKNPPTSLTIRLARPDETALVHSTMLTAFAEYNETLAVSSSANAETLEQTLADIAEGGAVLAWEADQLVASARFKLKPDHIYVGRVSVLPDQRHRGIATALMSYMEMVARHFGRERLRLGTRQSLPQNIDLYEKLGYQIVNTWPHPRGNDTVIWMAKKLA